jgi:hypothetical protein
MDHLRKFFEPPYIFLILGLVFLGAAMISTFTGESFAYLGRILERDKQPKAFWRDVFVGYLGGVFLIAYFFYKIYGH